MSDLSERIWIDPEDGERCSPYLAEKHGTAVEYIRADLAPVVGYSREHMLEIFCEGAITRGGMAEAERYLDYLTPAAKVPIPTGWIPVTERLPEVGVDVLCLWNDESKMMVVDALEQRSVSDGAGVQFVKNYIHNYSHWQPLPEPPKGRGGEGKDHE